MAHTKRTTSSKTISKGVIEKKIDQQAARLSKYAKSKIRTAETGLRRVERKAASYIRKNPEKAALIAAGVGAAVVTGVRAVTKRK